MTVIRTPKADEIPQAPDALQPPDEPTEVLFPEARRRERHRRLLVLAAAILVFGGTGLGYALSASSPPPPPQSRPTSPAGNNSSSVADNAGGDTTAFVATKVPGLFGTRPNTGNHESAIAFGAGSTWVIALDSKTRGSEVVRLSAETGQIEARIPITSSTYAQPTVENLAFGDGELWAESVVIEHDGYLLSEIDPSTDHIVRDRYIGNGATNGGLAGNSQELAFEGGALYLSYFISEKSLFATEKVAPTTGAVISTRLRGLPPLTPLGPPYPTYELADGTGVTVPNVGALATSLEKDDYVGITLFDNDTWVSDPVVSHPKDAPQPNISYVLYAFSASTGKQLSVSTPNIGLVTSGDGQLWGLQQILPALPAAAPQTLVISSERGRLVQIDPSNGHLLRSLKTPYPLPGPNIGGSLMAISHHALWFVNPFNSIVYRIAI